MAEGKTPIKISLAKLCRLLKEIVPDWLIFGIQLHIPLQELRSIESNSASRSLDDKFAMMLDQWLRKPPCTWSTVCDALEAIGNKRLAAEIETKYGKGNIDVDLKTLTNILSECVADWCNFGLMLGMPKRDLEVIDDRNPYANYLMNTLHHWMDNSDNVYWEVLIEAVRNIGNEKLACELEKEPK